MTLEEHISKMRQLAKELVQADKPVYLAANSSLSSFAERVFQKGENVSGSTFQYNSTNPLYVNPATTFGNTSALKPPRGKTGKTKFKSGKNHKTTWVESYKQLRGLVGREDGFVNWTAQGDLKSDILNNNTLTTRKVSEAEYKISSENSENQEKLRGLIKKYPNVFELSEADKKVYYKAFEFEFKKLLNQRLGNA